MWRYGCMGLLLLLLNAAGFTIPALLQKQTLWLPVRRVVETLGGKVIVPGVFTQAVLGNRRLVYTETNADAVRWSLNGKTLPLTYPVRLVKDTAFLHVDLVTSGLGLRVQVNPTRGVVHITDPRTGRHCDLYLQSTFALPVTPDVQRFFAAINQGDTATVRRMLARRPNLVNAALDYRSPLEAAVAGGYPEIADALLAANAYLYDRPLYTAVNTGSLSMVRYLAAHRGLINKNSVLLTALRDSHLNIADYLLTQGAVLAPQQALCDALDNRDMRVVAWILQHGVDVNTPVHDHDTPLVHAMDDLPMMRLLLERKADPNLPHGYDTPMHLVGDSLYTLQLLIAHGGNVNARNKFEQTPLYMPLGMDTAPYLIAHGAKINCRDKAKRTPLHRQSVLGDAMVVELLIQHGADVNARDNFSRTPLHFVKNVPTMAVLLEHGANPNAVDKDGNTPLHTLFDLPSTLGRIKNYYEEDSVIAYPDREQIGRMINRLLQQGADPTRRNKQGETPAQVARANNQSELALLLRPHK